MDAVFADLAVGAVKIGMLANEAAITAVADALGRWQGAPIVLDPVMVAGSGDTLLDPGAEFALRAHLLPIADILTPNLPEAARLLGAAEAVDETMMVRQGELLLSLGSKAVLMKGGHSGGSGSCRHLPGRHQYRAACGGPHPHQEYPWHGLHAVGRDRSLPGQGRHHAGRRAGGESLLDQRADPGR